MCAVPSRMSMTTSSAVRLTRPITSLALVVGPCCSRSKIVYHGNFFVANAHLCVGNFAVLIFVLIYTYLFRELPRHQRESGIIDHDHWRRTDGRLGAVQASSRVGTSFCTASPRRCWCCSRSSPSPSGGPRTHSSTPPRTGWSGVRKAARPITTGRNRTKACICHVEVVTEPACACSLAVKRKVLRRPLARAPPNESESLKLTLLGEQGQRSTSMQGSEGAEAV